MEDKIGYFGSSGINATLVLKKEDESEQLRVEREEEGLFLWRGGYNAASCVSRNEIYAFTFKNYQEVYRYSLESGTWSLFHPQ